jgi:PAS domain S-box-containing protein
MGAGVPGQLKEPSAMDTVPGQDGRPSTARDRDEAELIRLRRELDVRNRVITMFLDYPDEEVYGAISRVLMEALDSGRAMVGWTDANGTLVCPMRMEDRPPDPVVGPGRVELSQDVWGGIWGRAMEQKAVQWTNSSQASAKGHIKVDRVICAPIVHRESVVGGLIVANKPTDYGEEDIALMATLARTVAPVVSEKVRRMSGDTGASRASGSMGGSAIAAVDLLENANDLVQSVDPQGRYLYVNSAWLNTIGYTAEEVKHLTMWSVIHPNHWNHCRLVFKEIIGGKKKECVAVSFRTKDGATVELEGNLSGILEGGRLASTIGIFRNVTERKRIERDLAAQRNRSRVYLDLLTHDVNNLNQGVLTNMELLMRVEGLPVDVRRYAQRTHEQTIAISRLIRSVKKLSDLVDGHLKPCDVDGRVAIGSALERVRRAHPNRIVDGRLEMPMGEVVLNGNELLEEAFEYVLHYLVKVDPGDQASIVVVVIASEDGKAWRFFFKGSGEGMADVLGTRALEMGERTGGSVSIIELGLTIVSEVVSGLGGRAWVEQLDPADPEKGSGIVLELPRGQGHECESPTGEGDQAKMAIPW